MARPIKEGLDYFPLDTKLKGKVEYIRCLYGMMGVDVIINLWQRIYAKSYYVEYDALSPIVFAEPYGNQLELLFGRGEKKSYEIYDEIVKKAVEFKIFDEKMLKRYGILTSESIQEIYLECKKKTADEVIDPRYLLLSDTKNRVFEELTQVFESKTPVFAETIPQSKVKESKVNKSKIKQKKESKEKLDLQLLYEKNIGSLSPVIEDKIRDWESKVDESLIIYAIEEAVTYDKKNFKYIDRIIQNHYKAGRKTREDAEKTRYKKPDNRFNNFIQGSSTDTDQLEMKVIRERLKEKGVNV